MRRISLFLSVLLASFALTTPPAAASEMTEEELAGVLAGIHFFGGEEVPGYQEIRMVDGVEADSGLPRLVWTSHGVLDCGPPTSFPSLRAASFLRTVSPGDENFGNGIDKTHVWILEFEGDISKLAEGIAEVGVALFDAGAPSLADSTFPFAPTNGATRTVAAVFGPQLPGGEASVYGVTNQDNQLDVFANPFYIGVAELANGNTALVIAGPFSPGFAAYVSGLGEVVQSQEELRTRLAGYATDQRPAVVDALTDEQIASVPDGDVSFVAPGDDQTEAPVEPGGTDADPESESGDDGSTEGAADTDPSVNAIQVPSEEAEAPADPDDGEPGDEGSSGGGIVGWIFGLIVALVVAVGAYLLRNVFFGRSKRPEPAPVTPPPGTPTGGSPSGAPKPGRSLGGESATPDRDGPAPPLEPADPGGGPSCDWELWFKESGGWHKLREVAAGNKPCCIYKVTLRSDQSVTELASMRPGLPPGRVRSATSGFSSSPTFQQGTASTGSVRDNAGAPQPVLAELNTDALPDGFDHAEVAALIRHTEGTSFVVELDSDCDGAKHRYSAKGDATAKAAGQYSCDNTETDDCPIEAPSAATVNAAITGDLKAAATARHLLPRDQHDCGPTGGSGSTDVDAATATVTKDEMTWSSDFATSSMVVTGHAVPIAAHPTTDEVGTVAEYGAGLGITLGGAMTKGACGSGCCDGAPGPCLCAPSFDLSVRDVDSTPTQTLVVDGVSWDLVRQDFDERGNAGWEALPG